MKFLKEFGIGIIFAICLPILLVLIALVAVYGVLDFIVEFVIMVINFFSGKKCFPVFKEDEEAYKRKQEALNLAHAKNEPTPASAPTNVYVQQVYYNTNPNLAGQQGMPFPSGIPMPNQQGIQQPGIQFQPNEISQQASPQPAYIEQGQMGNQNNTFAPQIEQLPLQTNTQEQSQSQTIDQEESEDE
jgi:hypothetical protein